MLGKSFGWLYLLLVKRIPCYLAVCCWTRDIISSSMEFYLKMIDVSGCGSTLVDYIVAQFASFEPYIQLRLRKILHFACSLAFALVHAVS